MVPRHHAHELRGGPQPIGEIGIVRARARVPAYGELSTPTAGMNSTRDAAHLELIAFGSLVANKDSYSAAYAKFAEHWNARLMLRDVERVNPDFYPRPVIEAPSTDPRAIHNLQDRGSDYLTKDEFE